jgi:hypothetical protein
MGQIGARYSFLSDSREMSQSRFYLPSVVYFPGLLLELT